MGIKPIRRQIINKWVERLLVENKIDEAPIDIESVASSLEIDVVKVDDNDDVDGFLFRPEEESRNVVIGVNKNHGYNRVRFTIAHEIGHFLLHERDSLYLDGKHSGSTMLFRDKRSSTGEDWEEREANFFAAELLMPKSFLISDIESIQKIAMIEEDPELRRLAKRYRVSIQALTYRLANLKLVQPF